MAAFKRSITNCFLSWKDHPNRKPLILKGARQIGKSYTIREFGKENFENIIEINLEQQKKFNSLFATLEPENICAQLSLEFNQRIIPQKTLLFIDEIQESSDAILSLRYFYEKMPELHVIAAGSLLDLSFNREKSMAVPVGRIEYQYMHPLSFREFLEAMGENIALEFIDQISLKKNISQSIHEKFLNLFGQYLLCGGMPAVVKDFLASKSDLQYRKTQADIIETFKDDFRKYRTRTELDKIEAVYESLSGHVAKQIKYTNLVPELGISTIKNIFNLLNLAKVIHIVRAAYANGIPLGSEINERYIKFIHLDIGLLNSLFGLNNQDIKHWNLDIHPAGALAEQAAGQEFLAYSDGFFQPKLFFWKRDYKGSDAEVDFLYTFENKIFPIEVKSGSTGKLRSLKIFLAEKNCPLGIRVSQNQLSYTEKILSVPFYAISRLEELIKECLLAL